MKCELCHKADAACAITREKDGEEDELYVCESCAKKEKQRRQSKSQRTRKVSGLPPGVSMSVTEISSSSEGDEPPPILGAIVEAFTDMVNGIEKCRAERKKSKAEKTGRRTYPTAGVDRMFRMRDCIHLEGMHLIGELEASKRALHALGMELAGVESDGIHDAGHAYKVMYSGSSERAKRVLEDLVREEGNARARLRNEMPRVLGDSFCRSLAILKNCRLLSQGELFDLLSPMRIAALENALDGITLGEIEGMISGLDVSGASERLTQEERDRVDAERADEVNRRFEEVMLNDVL